jgi:hypothetical protein
MPIVPALAAVMIAYTFGEALGRLACISFGCCYGVSISKLTRFSKGFQSSALRLLG